MEKINELLNSYGGLISFISFIVSVFIYLKTGQIKSSIKSLLSHDKYMEHKKKTKKKLQGILDSIEKDNIFDNRLLGELNREMAALDHYAIFFDKKMKKNIKNMKEFIKCDCKPENKVHIIIKLSRLLGDLDINDVYVG